MKSKITNRWPLELPEERFVFHRDHPDWEVERLLSVHRNIKPDDVLIDIGTEVGDYAALFSTWGAKVFCIEPEPNFWPIIKLYFNLNDVKPLGCFAGFVNDTTKLDPDKPNFDYAQGRLWPKCAFKKVQDWHGFRNQIETAVSTPQSKLDDLIVQRGIKQVDVLNIDVEGAELHVLAGATTILSSFKPLVYVSVHPNMLLHDYGLEVKSIFDHMEQFGYQHKFLAENHEHHYVFWHQAGKAFR